MLFYVSTLHEKPILFTNHPHLSIVQMFPYHRESCLHAGVRRYACLREAATAKAGHAGGIREIRES
jgi:hypothetical protein